MKTVNEFIEELQKLKSEFKDKHIFIQAPNGIYFEPKIKLSILHPLDFENVENIIITYE